MISLLMIVNRSRYGIDSINSSAATLVADPRIARTIGYGANERLWSAVDSLQKTARTAKPGTRRELCRVTIFLRAAVSEGNSDLRPVVDKPQIVLERLHIVLPGGPLARGLGPQVGPGQSDFGKVPMLVIHTRISN
jgi:hypothetical protein